MLNELNISGPNKDFESIKKVSKDGVEYWTARELFPLLGYSAWQSFEDVITRSARAALGSGQRVENHFRRLTKLVEIGSGSKREVRDWQKERNQTSGEGGQESFGTSKTQEE